MATEAAITDLVEDLRQKIEAHQELLMDVAADLHAHPEIRFQEFHAAERLTRELEVAGFAVQRGFAGLDTAFVGTWSTPAANDDSTRIAVFCEYDALEGIGHACGHNIIAATGLGSALLIKQALDENPQVGGHVVVVGSPGEEGGAGKVPMIKAGVLDGVDLAMMIHPGGHNEVAMGSLARVALDVDFHGRASHAAAAPELGVNALDASTLAWSAIGMLRQQLPDHVRIHGIITNGGQAPNIIPEHTAMRCFVRSSDNATLLENVVPRVTRCFEGAALATGCEVTIAENTSAYLSLSSNPVLSGIAERAFRALGRSMSHGEGTGSTDMGNVSQVVPSIHPMIELLEGGTPHTREFAEAAASSRAPETILDGAVILAATAMSAYRDRQVVENASAAFSGTA